MKHAYLIIAHNEFRVLQSLIHAIDDKRNDIYIHFDKKVNNQMLPTLTCRYAGLHILNERVDVRWGDISVVEAEYALFETASRKYSYTYYHLLSGVDMPIKSQDVIHAFFQENSGKEFIGYTLNSEKEIERKVNYYHLFPRNFKNEGGITGMAQRLLRATWLRIQMALRMKRNRGIAFMKGTQWVSITHEMITLLIEKKQWVMRVFHHTFCPDEIFVQSICWNSPLKANIYNRTDDAKGCMRAIGWKDNKLTAWTIKDYTHLKDSEAMFARKFSEKDFEIVEKIETNIG